MEIVLIRHGESTANALSPENAIFCGRFDCPLTEKGEDEARSLRGRAELENADAVFVSPLRRTVQTAVLFGAENIITDARLTERTMGDFDGRKVREIMENPAYRRYFEDENYKYFRASFTQSAPHGESYADVSRRAEDFLRDVKSRGYRKIVVVSHMHAIRCILKAANHLTEAETLRLKIRQCEPITVVV